MKHEVHLEQNHGAADFRFDLAFGFHGQQGMMKKRCRAHGVR